MRQLQDKSNLVVRIERIVGVNAFAGMIEGTPRLDRKWRIMNGRREMQRPGVLVYGLDQLEAELTTPLQADLDWAPGEKWTARLVGPADLEKKTELFMDLTWYQAAEDPIERLAAILKDVSFMSYCGSRALDLDD